MLYCDMNTDGGNGCLNEIFIGGGCRSGDTLQTSFPMETTLTFMQPSFRLFCERCFNNSTPTTQTSFTVTLIPKLN